MHPTYVVVNLLLFSIILIAATIPAPQVETFQETLEVVLLLPSFKPKQIALQPNQILINQTGNRLTNSETEFVISNNTLTVEELKIIATSILPLHAQIKFVVLS